jgi:hypothetical protein
MAVNIPGQNLRGGRRRTNPQIVVYDAMGHLVRQHSFMHVINGYIYCVESILVPGPYTTGPAVNALIGILQLFLIIVDSYGHLLHLFSHIKYLLRPLK